MLELESGNQNVGGQMHEQTVVLTGTNFKNQPSTSGGVPPCPVSNQNVDKQKQGQIDTPTDFSFKSKLAQMVTLVTLSNFKLW